MPHHSSKRANTALWMTLSLLCATGCPPPEDSGEPLPGLVKGFGISPLGFPLDYSLTGEFYTEVASIEGGGAMWNSAWREDLTGGTDAGEVPELAAGLPELGDSFGFVPILVFGWRSGATLYLNLPDDPTNDWTNQQTRALFLSMLTEHARSYAPPIVFIGNENSFYFEQDPEDYARWVEFYEQAYDTIKAESPSTLVGTVFNFEHLSGQGQLTGWSVPRWEALEAHDLDKVDLLGVTTYPFLHHGTVDELPADWLDPLFSRIGSTPVAITETGWPAEDLGDIEIPWEQSPDAQVAYQASLGALLAGRDVRMVNWLFLNPMEDPGDASDEWQVFGSVSVRDNAGAERAVYQPWLGFSLRG